MTRLEIDTDDPAIAGGGFLSRQFLPPVTRAQNVFDVLFGIVAPILCFVFDPGVLRPEGFGLAFGPALFADYAAFVYIASALEILLLAVWLFWGRHLRTATHLTGGMLMTGAILSGLIGLVLLPFTLMGLFFIIGVFGFVPFLTALVYLRNARSAFQLAAKPLDSDPHASFGPSHQARGLGGFRNSLVATIVGGVLALGPPAALSVAASMFVSQAMDAVLSADERKADLAIDEIRYLQFFAQPELDRLVSAYGATSEPSRKEELKRRYLKLTGNDIEQRLRIVND